MTKQDLVAHLANKAGVTKKQAGVMLESFMDAVMAALKKGDSLTLTGFGTFKVSKRAARQGVNPRTRQKISIPAMKVPAFKAGKKFREVVK
ncbi:MAG: HU family DNA-binding protein [Candidatus Gracilibacteria bacterium]